MVLNLGLKNMEENNKTDLSEDLSFNLLPEEERLVLMKPHMYDPFDLPDKVIMHNPFTGKAIQYNKDSEPRHPHDINGYKILRNPLTSKILGKILYKDGSPLKVWGVNDTNAWEERDGDI